MVTFGISTAQLTSGLSPSDLAQEVESRGFDSLAFGEHTHIPVATESAMPPARIRMMASQFDPFVALAAAAAVTSRIRIGTGVTLIPEHHPLALAKTIASLDQVSRGRLFLGIGAGWNGEVENHGVAFKDRWKVTAEYIQAMRTIWREEEAEFHGQFVNFDPVWSFPKPTRPQGPPILMGASSRWSFDRIVSYCDGWMPVDQGDTVESGLEQLRISAERANKTVGQFSVAPFVPSPSAQRFEQLIGMGVDHLHLALPPGTAESQAAGLDIFAEMVNPFRAALKDNTK